jgi:hypothetical protein
MEWRIALLTQPMVLFCLLHFRYQNSNISNSLCLLADNAFPSEFARDSELRGAGSQYSVCGFFFRGAGLVSWTKSETKPSIAEPQQRCPKIDVHAPNIEMTSASINGSTAGGDCCSQMEQCIGTGIMAVLGKK